MYRHSRRRRWSRRRRRRVGCGAANQTRRRRDAREHVAKRFSVRRWCWQYRLDCACDVCNTLSQANKCTSSRRVSNARQKACCVRISRPNSSAQDESTQSHKSNTNQHQGNRRTTTTATKNVDASNSRCQRTRRKCSSSIVRLHR